MTSSFKDYLEKLIDVQNEKINEASKQGCRDVKCRREGYLEALFCIREFINYENGSTIL